MSFDPTQPADIPIRGVRDRLALARWSLQQLKQSTNDDKPSRLRVIINAARAKTLVWRPGKTSAK